MEPLLPVPHACRHANGRVTHAIVASPTSTVATTGCIEEIAIVKKTGVAVVVIGITGVVIGITGAVIGITERTILSAASILLAERIVR